MNVSVSPHHCAQPAETGWYVIRWKKGEPFQIKNREAVGYYNCAYREFVHTYNRDQNLEYFYAKRFELFFGPMATMEEAKKMLQDQQKEALKFEKKSKVIEPGWYRAKWKKGKKPTEGEMGNQKKCDYPEQVTGYWGGRNYDLFQVSAIAGITLQGWYPSRFEWFIGPAEKEEDLPTEEDMSPKEKAKSSWTDAELEQMAKIYDKAEAVDEATRAAIMVDEFTKHCNPYHIFKFVLNLNSRSNWFFCGLGHVGAELNDLARVAYAMRKYSVHNDVVQAMLNHLREVHCSGGVAPVIPVVAVEPEPEPAPKPPEDALPDLEALEGATAQRKKKSNERLQKLKKDLGERIIKETLDGKKDFSFQIKDSNDVLMSDREQLRDWINSHKHYRATFSYRDGSWLTVSIDTKPPPKPEKPKIVKLKDVVNPPDALATLSNVSRIPDEPEPKEEPSPLLSLFRWMIFWRAR